MRRLRLVVAATILALAMLPLTATAASAHQHYGPCIKITYPVYVINFCPF